MGMSYIRICAILLLCFGSFCGAIAHAKEPLRFKALPKDIAFSLRLASPHMAAAVDLNQDGLDEYILRPNDCGSLCTFLIAGYSANRWAIISEITARTLLMSDSLTNGVRNILVMRNDVNDFSQEIYQWDAQRSQYILLSLIHI